MLHALTNFWHMVKTTSSYAEGGQFDSRFGHYFYFSYFLVRVCIKTACNWLLSRRLCLVSLLKLSGHLNDAMSQFYRLFLAMAQKIRRWPYIQRKDVQWIKSHNQTRTFRLFGINKTAFAFVLCGCLHPNNNTRWFLVILTVAQKSKTPQTNIFFFWHPLFGAVIVNAGIFCFWHPQTLLLWSSCHHTSCYNCRKRVPEMLIRRTMEKWRSWSWRIFANRCNFSLA